jgi:3-hydroxybutyryl-CoA dehydratase
MGHNIQFDKGYAFKLSVQVTDEMVRKFADMCGDFNPIHLDDEYAKSTRFKQRIAHGMIVGALFSRALNDNMGSGGIYLSQTMKFMQPVFINDTVHMEFLVTAMRKEKGIATVETLAKKANGEIYAKGEAIVMVSTAVV